MNIDRLKMFMYVCMYGTVSKASEKLYISQPAVSQGIKELERELGVSLFERKGRNLVLTSSGIALYPYAQSILKESEAVIELFNSKKLVSSLKIGCTVTMASFVLPVLVYEYERESGIHVEVIVDNVSNINKLISDNEIDIAIVEGKFANDSVLYEKLMNLDLVFVASPTYSSVNCDTVSLLVREEGSSYRNHMNQFIMTTSESVEIKWVANNNETLLHAALNHQGVALLPQIVVQELIKSNDLMVYMNQTNPINQEVGMITNQFCCKDDNIKSFKEFLARNHHYF
ncbi:LysR family transcriptional regulator [Erysipelothrix inopinata]|uniref:LysR family transcriptional regulator n=1 Tax=Erysipelothrix inopinata TaxID=225084 RepID=A0A7G9RZH5_9FIRM|nr:LysR family transcriptional regulator [Erysipelothrix inopinata]QNN61000.1 LysR family transcriptional regulator [Erysipelothrix inopinata]